MDRWLKGEQNGIDKEPPVSVWFEVRDTPAPPKANWTSTFTNWPIPETRWQTLFLTANGNLVAEKPVAPPSTGDRLYTFPSGTELVGNNLQFAIPPDGSGTLGYRSEPLTADLTIIGAPQVAFHVTSERDDTDFMVVLHDISPTGDTLYLQRGFLRASMRAVDPSRSLPHYLFRPFTRVEAVVPGQPYEIRISLPPVGHVFRKGHQVELMIMAPSPTPTPDWGLMPVDLPGRNTVHHSVDRPASLTLPVIAGLTAQAPEPTCGSLEFQPCRHAPAQLTTSAGRSLKRRSPVPPAE